MSAEIAERDLRAMELRGYGMTTEERLARCAEDNARLVEEVRRLREEVGRRLTMNDRLLAIPYLAPREREAIRLRADGLAWPQVADRMGVSLNTVKAFRRRAKDKLGDAEWLERRVAIQP